MALRKLKPTTPGQRFRIVPDFSGLHKGPPEKSLLGPNPSRAGRNRSGRMTVRNVGGGHKRRYRQIDFRRDKEGIEAVVKTIEYDPNRSARIALLFYVDGEKRYILSPHGLNPGQRVVSGPKSPAEVGNALPLSDIPLGTIIHNIELRPGKGGVLVRSAGNYAQLVAREGMYCSVKLPSSEVRKVRTACYASVGSLGNAEQMSVRLGKAGRNRWLGRRPRVRGVAMNPVDHPMGGGEGKASGGQPRSRKGLYSKGLKTRKTKKYSDSMIITPRK